MIEIIVKAERKEKKNDIYGNRLRNCVDLSENPFVNTERVTNELKSIVKEQEVHGYTEKEIIQALGNDFMGDDNINNVLSTVGIVFAFVGIMFSNLVGAEFLSIVIRVTAVIAPIIFGVLIWRIAMKHKKVCYVDKFIINILQNWDETCTEGTE